MHIIKRFLADEAGATAIEYAVLAALVGIGMLAGLNVLGDGLDDHYDDVNTAVNP